MRLHNRALVAVILSLAGFYSCSRQATIPTQLTYTPVPVFTIPDSLLATSPIEYAFYKAEPVEFFEPKPEVRDSFNRLCRRSIFRPPARIGIRPGRPGRGCFCFSPARRKGIISLWTTEWKKSYRHGPENQSPGHRSVSFRRNRQNDRLEPGLWQRSRRASLQRPGNGIRP